MYKIKVKFTAELEMDFDERPEPLPIEKQRENLQQELYDYILDSDEHTSVKVTDYKMIMDEENIKNGN